MKNRSAGLMKAMSNISAHDLPEIRALVRQLSSSAKPLTRAAFEKICADKNLQVLCLRDEKKKVIAMGTLVVMRTVVGVRARIEDVVVDEAHRGKGLGEKLTRALITLAKKYKCQNIELSSRPSRVAANALYQKLGFERKETNVYRLKLG